jgi:hypothetical protein
VGKYTITLVNGIQVQVDYTKMGEVNFGNNLNKYYGISAKQQPK